MIDRGVASNMCVKLKDIPALFVRWVARIKLRETPSGRGCDSFHKEGHGLAPAGADIRLKSLLPPL